MGRRAHRKSRVFFPLALLSATALLVAGSREPAAADDRDLLRFNTANPYLMMILDTSASMNLRIGSNDPAPGHGDDVDSKIYTAKEALFTVFHDVSDVNFGFVTFNQNRARVQGKHWLYYTVTAPGGSYPNVGWPVAAPATVAPTTSTVVDGLPVVERNPAFTASQADHVVFGTTFRDAANNPMTTAGTCASPLRLGNATERARVNAFAKGESDVTIWVQTATGNRTYRLTIFPPGATEPKVSANTINIKIAAEQVNNCASPPAVGGGTLFQFVKDQSLDEFLMVDHGVNTQNDESTAALWSWRDSIDGFSCASSQPFTGYAAEGNYDSDRLPSEDGIVDPDFEAKVTDEDEFCVTVAGVETCTALKPVLQTSYDPRGRALDRGDFLPFDWTESNREEFMRRLAPNYNGSNIPNFGIASYFADTSNAAGFRPLKDSSQAPLLAQGDTALARVLTDVRCWYMGTAAETGNSKCRDTAFGSDFEGWRNLACNEDTGDPNYGCRKPFVVVITDGEEVRNCQVQSPTASVSDLDQFSGVKTWVLNVGPQPADPDKCPPGLLNSIAQSGGGICVNVATRERLITELGKILGQVREAARAFASAAVPTVQATAEQTIYVSNFTPLNDQSVWDGHMNAFLKPLPLLDDGSGRPDTSIVCPATGERSGCFLWDAGEVLRTDQYKVAPDERLSWTAGDKRRVYYSMDGNAGNWPRNARLFEPTVKGSTLAVIEFDLWRAMGITFNPDASDPTAEATNDAARATARTVIERTLALKTAPNPEDPANDPREWLLGDVFHSNPVVVGSPVNLRYFAEDLGTNGEDCEADGSGDTGYRCFFARHKFRRKVLVVGHNDGMLHAYNAGLYDAGPKEFSAGNGREIFGFMPRTVLPVVRRTSVPGSKHEFSVDESPVAADVFIDPLYELGTPDPAEREWRTVVVGGLREGGRAYYALDVTQPDVVTGPSAAGEFTPVNATNDDTQYVPACIAPFGSVPTGCGPVPYGAPLWEFTDSARDSLAVLAQNPIPMDEEDVDGDGDQDGNGTPDLGFTWSTPDIGRIRVCTGGDCAVDVEDRFVAIFGGGMDPNNKSAPRTGLFLYMVDIETGKVLYKRQLKAPDGSSAGAIPSAPAAVDTNQDGYFDRIYIGTTGGYLFRADLGRDASGNFPELTTQSVRRVDGGVFDALRIVEDSGGDPAWAPKVIFDANVDTVTGTRARRAIFYRPSVFFVAKLGTYGIAFGSGEREDLWETDGTAGRFYVMVDDSDKAAVSLPFDEGDLRRIEVDPATTIAEDLFVSRGVGERGWYMVLDKNERLITPGFSLFGVMFFSTYNPLTVATSDPECDPLEPCPADDPTCDPNNRCPAVEVACSEKKDAETGYCSKTGTSRLFVVNATNANGLLPNPTDASSRRRFKAIAQFVTQPFSEPGQNKNPDDDPNEGPTADDLSADDLAVMEIIKGLYPDDCKFTSYRVDIKTIASDTSVQRIAAVPVCIIDKNWKEF